MSDIWLPWNPFHFFHSRKVAKKRIDDLVPIVLTSRPSLPALPARRHCREKCHVDGENDVNGSLPNYDRDVHSTQATCVWVSRMKHFLIFSWQIEATKASCNVCFVWDMSKLWRTSTTGFPTEDHALLVIYWTSAGIQHCWKSRCCLLQWLWIDWSAIRCEERFHCLGSQGILELEPVGLLRMPESYPPATISPWLVGSQKSIWICQWRDIEKGLSWICKWRSKEKEGGWTYPYLDLRASPASSSRGWHFAMRSASISTYIHIHNPSTERRVNEHQSW